MGVGGKVARPWSWPLTSVLCRNQEWRSFTTALPFVFISWCIINKGQRQLCILTIQNAVAEAETVSIQTNNFPLNWCHFFFLLSFFLCIVLSCLTSKISNGYVLIVFLQVSTIGAVWVWDWLNQSSVLRFSQASVADLWELTSKFNSVFKEVKNSN
jgi:hypothetical protein